MTVLVASSGRGHYPGVGHLLLRGARPVPSEDTLNGLICLAHRAQWALLGGEDEAASALRSLPSDRLMPSSGTE